MKAYAIETAGRPEVLQLRDIQPRRMEPRTLTVNKTGYPNV